jgi:hypothetical protein
MASNTQNIDEHVGVWLSGYIDGELTQQQRQRVEIHCGTCGDCERELNDLRALRRDVSNSRLSEYGEDVWRENMDDATVKITQGIGWLLFLGAVLICGGIGIYEFVLDSSMGKFQKVLIGAVYGGLALLFFSVLRQRLIERKSDKYKDVEI